MRDALEFNAGPTHMKASGGTTVNVILAVSIVGATFYAIWTTNQQTILLSAQHDAIINLVNDNSKLVIALTRANDNVFLSTMLPNERKKELPDYIQDRVREIVESRAENITNERSK